MWWALFKWGGIATVVILVIVFMLHKLCFKKLTNPLKSHKGKKVIVVGGSQGIGYAIAERVIKDGASHVFLVARTESKLKIAQKKLSEIYKDTTVYATPCDVSKYEDVKKLLKTICDKVKTIDVIYLSHGIGTPGYFLEQSIEKMRSFMDVNYFGVVNFCKVFIPLLLKDEKNDKHVILMSSGMGLVNFLGNTGYCPSKWAIRSFGECMEQEFLGTNIHFHNSFPGDVDTPGYKEELKERVDMPDCDKMVKGAGLQKPSEAVDCIMRGLKSGRFNLVEGFELTASLECTRGLGVMDRCPFLVFCYQMFFLVAIDLFMYDQFTSVSFAYSDFRKKRMMKWIGQQDNHEE